MSDRVIIQVDGVTSRDKFRTGTPLEIVNGRFAPRVVRFLPPSVVLTDGLVVRRFRVIRNGLTYSKANVYGVTRTPRWRMRMRSQFTGERIRTNPYQEILP